MPTKIQTNGSSLYLKVQSLEYPEQCTVQYLKVQSLEYPEQRLLSCCLMSLSPVCSRPAELPTSRLCTSALKEQCHQLALHLCIKGTVSPAGSAPLH